MYYTVYVGPYIKVKHKEINEKVTKKGCVNEKCDARYMELRPDKYNGDSFCSKCGRKIQDYTTTKVSKDYVHDVIVDEYEETLRYAGEGQEDIILCNRDIDGKLSHHDKYDDYSADERDPKSEMKWFYGEYGEELEALEERVEELSIHWGVVTFSS